MSRLKLVGSLFVTLFLLNSAMLFCMQGQRHKEVVQQVEGDTGLIADYWFAIEDVGLPLDATVFEGKFTLEQMIDFLKTIKEWQGLRLRYQNMKRLVRIFEKKYSGVLLTEDEENVYCAVCGRSYKRYAPCVRHILIKHFCFDQVFKFAEE